MPTGHRNTSFGFFGYFLMAVLVMLVWMVGWVQASLILPADAHTTPRQEHQSSAAEYRGINSIEVLQPEACARQWQRAKSALPWDFQPHYRLVLNEPL
jgi:hypothetical protein